MNFVIYLYALGNISPLSLVDLCAKRIRDEAQNIEWRKLPLHIVDTVVFHRDKKGILRGRCKECREDCCVGGGSANVADKNVCLCGHNMASHEIVQGAFLLLAALLVRINTTCVYRISSIATFEKERNNTKYVSCEIICSVVI